MKMLRLIIIVTAIAWTVSASPYEIPDPRDVAPLLNEDQFEDYLDFWLAEKQQSSLNASSASIQPRNGCSIRVNGDLGQPQPVFIHQATDSYLRTNGNTGFINLGIGEEVTVSCPGSGRTIAHPLLYSNVQTGTVRCVNNALISGAGWLNGAGAFGDLTCTTHPHYEARDTNKKCYNNNVIISVGFNVNGIFYPLYWSCFDQKRLEVLYVYYNQDATNAVFQTGVSRPPWIDGGWFPGVDINDVYRQVTQKATVVSIFGQALADEYITSRNYLTRGHLAAKSDYVFASGQRSTFVFVNAAPQWYLFNSGNWNSVEQDLRFRIAQAGYSTVIYTGTFGVTQLRNSDGRLVDVYMNGDTVPVPQYFYKVAYDQSRQIGTVFVSINNPHYTLEEVRALQFCTDRCRNNAAFNWLKWLPDRIDLGYSFCCTVDDFKRKIPHVPNIVANGLLS